MVAKLMKLLLHRRIEKKIFDIFQCDSLSFILTFFSPNFPKIGNNASAEIHTPQVYVESQLKKKLGSKIVQKAMDTSGQ